MLARTNGWYDRISDSVLCSRDCVLCICEFRHFAMMLGFFLDLSGLQAGFGP